MSKKCMNNEGVREGATHRPVELPESALNFVMLPPRMDLSRWS